MGKKCKKASLLHLYIDEELSQEQKVALEIHLKECDFCRNELETLRQTNSLLMGMGEIEPSDSFSRSFWEKVDAYDEKNTSEPVRSFFQNFLRPRFVVALTVLIIAGVIVYENNFDRNGSEQMIMTVDLEMLQEFELVDNLDLLENLDDLMAETEEG